DHALSTSTLSHLQPFPTRRSSDLSSLTKRLGALLYFYDLIVPLITSSLCATNASITSFFSRSGTSKCSSELAKTSPAASNSSEVNFRSKCVGSNSNLSSLGIVLNYFSE